VSNDENACAPAHSFVQRAEEVDDLADRARQVFGRFRFDLARHAVQSFVQEHAQRPARQ